LRIMEGKGGRIVWVVLVVDPQPRHNWRSGVVGVVRFWRVLNRSGSARKASVVITVGVVVVVVVLVVVDGGGDIFSFFLLVLATDYPTILSSYLYCKNT